MNTFNFFHNVETLEALNWQIMEFRISRHLVLNEAPPQAAVLQGATEKLLSPR